MCLLPFPPVHYLPTGFFTSQIEKAEIPVRTTLSNSYSSRARSRQELDDLEERLSEHENRLLQMNNSHETMQRRYLELTELKHVLRETTDFFREVHGRLCFDCSIHAKDLENNNCDAFK